MTIGYPHSFGWRMRVGAQRPHYRLLASWTSLWFTLPAERLRSPEFSLRREIFPITAFRLTPISRAISRAESPLAQRLLSSSILSAVHPGLFDNIFVDPKGFKRRNISLLISALGSTLWNCHGPRASHPLSLAVFLPQSVSWRPREHSAMCPLSHKFFQIADVESASVTGTRSVSAFSVAMGPRLPFRRCTEKYLFRLFLKPPASGKGAQRTQGIEEDTAGSARTCASLLANQQNNRGSRHVEHSDVMSPS